ncbi:unnamed protein product [Linum tenue]|uniref:Uncharacterized protein n=1 Tax=Linum tenue TaxID=586396 RepID=A0AAV0NPU4_9ROSI|nr:unnamed protein product [Linum tenue]
MFGKLASKMQQLHHLKIEEKLASQQCSNILKFRLYSPQAWCAHFVLTRLRGGYQEIFQVIVKTQTGDHECQSGSTRFRGNHHHQV